MLPLRIHPEVLEASRSGQPVVALETAVLTHGLPREPMAAPTCCSSMLAGTRGWDATGPANLELARSMTAAVRKAGAIPATIGVLGGTVVVGLDDAELLRLGADRQAVKVSTRDLAVACALGQSGGTTVAGTLAAIDLANASLPRPIRVFATGGIGGVHRGWTARPDVSNDLATLARVAACVVSAGAKSILDLEATIEVLDSLGVPVLGLGTEWFPRFLTAGAAPLRVQRAVPDAATAARICAVHWGPLGQRGGVLLANPPPAAFAMPLEAMEATVAAGIADAARQGVQAAEVTPYLLAHLARATGGRSVEANVAALLHNATVAADLARCLAGS